VSDLRAAFFLRDLVERGQNVALIPPHFANVWERYLERVKNYSLPDNARFRQIHNGRCTFMQPDERGFVTPEAIRATCVVGTPDEIVA
jgi:hypothetical protein